VRSKRLHCLHPDLWQYFHGVEMVAEQVPLMERDVAFWHELLSAVREDRSAQTAPWWETSFKPRPGQRRRGRTL